MPVERQLDILLTVFPNLKRIGILTHDPALEEKVTRLRGLCDARKVELVHVQLSRLPELPSKLDQLLTQVDLIWSLPDPELFQPQLAQHIIAQCAERNVPLLGLSANFVRAGATVSFEPDYREVGRLLAREVLSRQATAPLSDLTIAAPRRIVVGVNQRAFQHRDLPSDFGSPDVVVEKH